MPDNILLYNHFNNIVNFLVSSEMISDVKLHNEEIIYPELLQIVNAKGELLTKLPRKYVETQIRVYNKKFKNDFAYRHIYGLVISNKNTILIQKRSENKDNPNLWDKFVGGHVEFAETTIIACKRELYEELGLKFLPEKHKLQIFYQQIEPKDHERVVPNPTEKILENMCFDLFVISNVSEKEVQIDNFEVKGYLWVTFDELRQISQTEAVTYDLNKIVNQLRLIDIIEEQMIKCT